MAADEMDQLVARFTERDALIGVIGLGYIGLPLSLAAVKGGFQVLGFDINDQRVAGINRGESPLKHIGDDRILAARGHGRFAATADFSRLAEPDAIVLCVPTPLGRHREPDLSFVESSARAIAATLRRGQLVVLESTTYPGTTREVVKPILEAGGLVSGKDFFLAYSPEREDPGNLDFETARIPKVVSGDGAAALRLAQAFYDRFVVRTIPVSSPEAAEAVKLTENIFRAVNVALVNELKIVFSAMGIDVFEVIEAASTKPFGFMPFHPGPGLGGHCIPIDPFYLTWKARELDIATRFIELAGEVNIGMPAYVVGRLREALDRRFGKGLTASRILIVGLAYKKNVDDMRESPALTIMAQLERAGAQVDYHDPYFPDIRPSRQYPHLCGRPSVPLQAGTLSRYDAAVIVTDHDGIDYALLVQHLRLIVDTRNVIERLRLPGRADKVVKA